MVWYSPVCYNTPYVLPGGYYRISSIGGIPMIQEIIVPNKKQLLVALSVAENSPCYTEITMLKSGTVYHIPPFTNLRKVRGKLRRTEAKAIW